MTLPEISELAIMRDQLNKEFSNKTLNSVKLIGGKFIKDNKQNNLLEQNLQALSNDLNSGFYTKLEVKTHGKFMYWQFDNCPTVFFFSMGMTGGFGQKNKHSAIEFVFDQEQIYFNDIRHFGNFSLQSKNQLKEKLSDLGWDCLQVPVLKENEKEYNYVLNMLNAKKYKSIYEVLMDQSIFSGVGNYLRAEALYKAQISPFRRIKDLDLQELNKLFDAISEVAHEAYKYGGATLLTFKDVYNQEGSFFKHFQVYGRKKDFLNNTVLKAKDGNGRTIHYVPEIQK